ncbi:MAG TPA: hypothetical protein VIM02_07145 [Rhizomicrobium sp.]|jgi:DMSO/TMAO reductase YedYZ heme-binding membrane subunit
MVTRAILLLLGLLHLANGLWMLAAPEAWYAAIPGVAMTGPINHHFIQDIGLAFMASGAGMALGLRVGVVPAALALAGATWPMLHALLHIWGWLTYGFPADTQIATSELVGVVLVSAVGFALAWINARKEGAL